MSASSIIRIDRATVEELSFYERNILRERKKKQPYYLRILAETLLNRIRTRQYEWAEQNWKTHAVQQEFIQTMAKARIAPPSF